MKKGSGGGEGRFRVLPQPPVSADPAEEPLHHPSAGVNCKADLIGWLADDLDGDAGRRRRSLSSIALLCHNEVAYMRAVLRCEATP